MWNIIYSSQYVTVFLSNAANTNQYYYSLHKRHLNIQKPPTNNPKYFVEIPTIDSPRAPCANVFDASILRLFISQEHLCIGMLVSLVTAAVRISSALDF